MLARSRTILGYLPRMVMRRVTAASGAEAPPAALQNLETLSVTFPRQHVALVSLNRPTKLNAINDAMWEELRQAFDMLSEVSACRAIVLAGNGRHFCAGIDLSSFSGEILEGSGEAARRAYKLKKLILRLQDSFNAIERCSKPVIAAVHGACIGGGVDMIAACDIRHCTADSYFQIKEVDIGLAADVGTLQRLPKIVGNDSLVRELAYTARKLPATESLQFGLVSRIYDSEEAMHKGALDLAEEIGGKSPIAVHGTKVNLNFSRDHSVAESLDYMATWNAAMIQTDDIMEAVQATQTKARPVFSKL